MKKPKLPFGRMATSLSIPFLSFNRCDIPKVAKAVCVNPD
tara:strand:- start:2010 stop:2129 length:120 start_codon:yes stop_codon:yes gene_type:complete